MKKILRIIAALAAFAAVIAVFSSCDKIENINEQESGSNAENIITVEKKAVIDNKMSPENISEQLPAETFPLNFDMINLMDFNDGYNDNDEKYMTSADGKYAVTYLTNDGNYVYAYKFSDIDACVNYYYYIDTKEIYCVSVEDYNEKTDYYVNSDGILCGIRATTFNDSIKIVETVYDKNGCRVAAVYRDQSKIYFLDKNLFEITGDEYNQLTEDLVVEIG